ncbi:Beta-lactamase/transpeptidase-like protein [Niveomyces insectorum RCEF 264]|uniref:Beta-lactamase/transpeptidase-like protein n=1 Tax=Niveomyces insectorum RCEF 264 TaxID=1081102 RepID=A0A167S422_9HYPO|nr:Beta-lactamase/transpeptidase-like protein [Niveomyces insectorum RCEF 264]
MARSSLSQLVLLASALSPLASAGWPFGSDVLRYGSPESVGMKSGPLHAMVANLTSYTHAANYGSHTFGAVHPIEPGGVVVVGHKNTIVSHFAFGKRSLYADANGTFLPRHQQEDATVDTLYDLASLTKMFTTVAALRELDAGRIALDAPVAQYVPAFAANGKANVTILMLLTHTSGFDADPSPPLYTGVYPTYADKIHAVVTQALLHAPGSTYLYSDLNFMNLMVVLETVTGRTLDALIADFTRPMGMASTFFNRGNVEGWANPHYVRTAPQEFQIEVLGPSEPQRPQPVRGTVHDENAWALHGVSGHAGLFSTAEDTAKLCQMILNNGTYAGRRILSQASVDKIFTNYNAHFNNINDDHGLGFELDQYYTAGPLASLLTASHTGFTGTSLVIDRGRDLFYVHFANRVHPSRTWSSNNIVREMLGYWVGTSLGLDLVAPL